MTFNRLLAGFAILTIALLVVPAIKADPAVVIKDGGLCGMLGSDANGNFIFGGIGDATTIVENDNKVMLKCKGTDLTNLSGSGQSYSEFGCGIIAPTGGFYITSDSHATVAANGNGTLTCTAAK